MLRMKRAVRVRLGRGKIRGLSEHRGERERKDFGCALDSLLPAHAARTTSWKGDLNNLLLLELLNVVLKLAKRVVGERFDGNFDFLLSRRALVENVG